MTKENKEPDTEQKKLRSVSTKQPLTQSFVEIGTKYEITWCPGCPNFMNLASIKNALSKLIKEGYKQENFAMCTGIGCFQKIFDYINISGVYGLHGRVLPVCLGMKLANPNLVILGFAGDGDAYAEGIEHLIHSARYNLDMTYIVANNQNFALTTGQGTPSSEIGFKSKAEPLGEFNRPFNTVKIALASGASFVARCNPRDMVHTTEIIEKAIKHKGFAFIEMIQDCLIFHNNPDMQKRMYKVDNKNNMDKALEIAREWDYSSKESKIPIGIIYQEERTTLDEEWPQFKKLKELKTSWKGMKK